MLMLSCSPATTPAAIAISAPAAGDLCCIPSLLRDVEQAEMGASAQQLQLLQQQAQQLLQAGDFIPPCVE
eukprot:657146-Hanusia_phi.AAC.4